MARRHVGPVLRRIREERGYTQARLAKLAGVDPVHLSQIETSVRGNPRFETIAKIAYALGVTLDSVALQTGLKPPLTANVNVDELRRIIADARTQLDALEEELGE